MKKCINLNCRREIPDYCVFCMYCGTKLEPQKSECPHCGFDDIPDIALFCPNSDKKLDDSQHPDNREVLVADTATASNGLPPVLQRLVGNMVLVQGGTFMMGATPVQARDACDNENPAHQVTLSTFRIGKYPVTQQEWKAVMGRNPSQNTGDNLPVENVSWHDCQGFIAKLNEMTGKTFRLPTEAEWEFAARGGLKTKGFKYSGSDDLDEVAWHVGNSAHETHPVGLKSPNELRLYDMSGNVCEWCSDWYDKGYYKSSPRSNPQGPTKGSNRVNRGGAWNNQVWFCRVSFRLYAAPTTGTADRVSASPFDENEATFTQTLQLLEKSRGQFYIEKIIPY